MKPVVAWAGCAENEYYRVVVTKSAANTPLAVVEVRQFDTMGEPKWERTERAAWSVLSVALLALHQERVAK